MLEAGLATTKQTGPGQTMAHVVDERRARKADGKSSLRRHRRGIMGRCPDQRDAAQCDGASADRTAVAAVVGSWRDLQPDAGYVRTLLFLAEGRPRSGALRDVSASHAVHR